MSVVLQDLSAQALVTAIEANLFEFASLLRHWPQAEVHDDPELLWTITDIPFALFNSIFRAQLRPENVDAAIQAAISRCRSRGVPLMWWTGPSTRPDDLGAYLEARGFTHTMDSPGMAADLRTLNEGVSTPSDLIIKQVSDVDTLKQWCRVFALGFGMPDFVEGAWLDAFASVGLGARQPLRHYLGWSRGKPVAASTLLLGAGVAGIYNVVTVPDARRQGIGATMTLAALREACTLGYRIGILHASDMGLGVYCKTGFQEYCKIGCYVWTAQPEQGGEATGAA